MRKWVPLAQMEVADNKGATEDSYIEPVSRNMEGNVTSLLTSTLISLGSYYHQTRKILLSPPSCTLYAPIHTIQCQDHPQHQSVAAPHTCHDDPKKIWDSLQKVH